MAGWKLAKIYGKREISSETGLDGRFFRKEADMRVKVQKFFTGEKVLLASRLILGSIFIAAIIGKLQHQSKLFLGHPGKSRL